MKQVAYWDLENTLTKNTKDIDFTTLAYDKEILDILVTKDLVSYSDDKKWYLTTKADELTMDDIEELLYEYDFELVFPNMAEASCV